MLGDDGATTFKNMLSMKTLLLKTTLATALSSAFAALAQTAPTSSVLAPVVVTATRTEARAFDIPASIDRIGVSGKPMAFFHPGADLRRMLFISTA